MCDHYVMATYMYTTNTSITHIPIPPHTLNGLDRNATVPPFNRLVVLTDSGTPSKVVKLVFHTRVALKSVGMSATGSHLYKYVVTHRPNPGTLVLMENGV